MSLIGIIDIKLMGGKMKKILLTIAVGLMVFSVSPVQAADSQGELPTWYNYATEWISLNIFTWKSESKVKLLDDLATKRVNDIQTANEIGSDEEISTLADRYLQIKEQESNWIETKNISIETMNMVATREMERQRILSRIRQESKSEDIKTLMIQVQEEAVNRTKSTIDKMQEDADVEKFENDIVSAWRDPDGTVDADNEMNTRVYAAGTTGEGVNGVLVDGGEAKITKNTSGELKIEHAPGTGPSSVTSDSGQKKWTIQQSNGNVIDDYTSSGWVVIGQSNGISSNIIVNTTGGDSSSAQTTSGGTSTIIIKGGSASVEDDSNSSGNGQNVVD